ncbi:MAG: hypothetical protein IK152_03440 [Lachnospiraceae bacterium]|nr:hypothetical protein [Lachnospiraceae bacterium]
MTLFKRITDRLADSGKSLQERLFILITFATTIGVLVSLIGDIIIGEHIVEIILLIGASIIVPLTALFYVRYNIVKIGARIIALGVVFVMLPIVFIFGGGLEAGFTPWVVFVFLYVSLILTGVWRVVMMIIMVIEVFLAFFTEYYYPNIIHFHDKVSNYIDFFISLVVVGFEIYIVVWFQKRLFMEENNRAREETKRADELNRAQNRFFSSMSHEIRTPINSILGLNELILRRDDASEEIIKDAMNISGSGKMLLGLVNDILDFSKIEAGSMEIIPVDYRVEEMLPEIVNMVWLRANEKGLAFDINIDPNIPSVLFGDEFRIKQIIVNLLNNAIKYTQEGSVSLHVESERSDDRHVFLIISVSDTGIGIRQEAMPRLFDAFQRVDEERNRLIEGTGLGLSIVRQLVNLMEGEISVNSVYGQGSTFTVRLRQEISNETPVGNINISAVRGAGSKRKHESMLRRRMPGFLSWMII